jgi:hypothetical protein
MSRPGRVVGFGAVGLAIALDVWATTLLAHAMGPANDLFPRWYGTRAWLLGGLDPYAPAVDEGIRRAMGGAPGEPLGAFVFGFVYPGYVALLLAPLALLPFSHAAPLWLLLAQAAIGTGAWCCWRAYELERRWPAATPLPALAAAVLFPASLVNLTFGQFAAIVFASVAGSWWLLVRHRPGWAGVVLALGLVKPSVALLPTAALLLWAARSGRPSYAGTRMLAAWLACAAALIVGSLLALPGWPQAFWRSTADYARVASASSAAGLLAAVLLRGTGWSSALHEYLTPGLATGGISILAAAAVWAGWRTRCRSGQLGCGRPERSTPSADRCTAGHVLAAGALLGAWLVPPLYEWNSVLLLVPLLAWLRSLPGAPAAPLWGFPRRLGWRGGAVGSRAPEGGRRGCPGARPLTAGALIAASLLTLPAIARWPSESRLVWPLLVLVGWALAGVRAYPGTKKTTRRAGTSPSSPAAA